MDSYIGITDFTEFWQVEQMLTVFKKNLKPNQRQKRRLHVGVMMSRKTLLGIETKWAKAFPPKERIVDIFGSDEVMNCLHYADYENTPDFWADLFFAINFGGTGIHALQLDMIWPDPGQIVHAVHSSRKQLEIILQIGKNAMEEVGDDSAKVVERLGDYEDVIHRVLLDKSMGKGKVMNPNELLPYARAIRDKFPNLGIGFAGGLGPETIQLIEPILDEFPDASFDAQGRLRPSHDALDPIDWNMASKYIIEASKFLPSSLPPRKLRFLGIV